MTRLRTIPGAPVLALALAACAEKPANPPVDGASNQANPGQAVTQNAPAKKPEYKRPPIGMNDRGDVSSISLEKIVLLHQSAASYSTPARSSSTISATFRVKSACRRTTAINDRQPRAKDQERARRRQKSIVVYCTSLTCPDARTVAMHIAGFGYSSTIFSGGWDAWRMPACPSNSLPFPPHGRVLQTSPLIPKPTSISTEQRRFAHRVISAMARKKPSA